ncbi:hypothetical protein CEXT_737381 [Caerostris extrusa]|uniref:Uncharacterized protein n=2 Tax=Caerostris TaxID=172845 RepID=A0AAV4XK07_CAEEX|nr:hypothetical protein CEXT_737381 [Caerostris extrusa]
MKSGSEAIFGKRTLYNARRHDFELLVHIETSRSNSVNGALWKRQKFSLIKDCQLAYHNTAEVKLSNLMHQEELLKI